jgi:hypothetical protein
MQPEAPLTFNSEPNKGLPPVVPLSGKFIVQLFLVPGLIVAFAVLLILVVSWLVPSSRTPEQFLLNLDRSNADVRWRAADDLAQVLLRDDQLASNPKFALDLAERLRQALQAAATTEQSLGDRLRQPTPSAPEGDLKTLEAQRSYIVYLSACLGNCTIPVGAPLLNELAVSEDGADAKGGARRRLQSVWALATLGENLKRFDKLPLERQGNILAKLEDEVSGGRERADWARAALEHLKGRGTGSPQALGVEQTLVKCAGDANPSLRKNTALALSFWEGDAAENARMEQALLKLTRDDGHGQELVEQLLQDDKYQRGAEGISRLPGLSIRYQAALALLRRGSAQVPLDLVREMLDEQALLENFQLKQPDGKVMPDEATARTTVVATLLALNELHRKQPSRDLTVLDAALEQLAHSPHAPLRSEAQRTRIELGRN